MNIHSFSEWSRQKEKGYVKINLFFILIFLNVWDFVVNRAIFNGMVLGALMFGPAVFLWLVGSVRASALVTIISIFEFMLMAIFLAEGLELGGLSSTLKSVFWFPYLVMAGLNGFWGLKIYNQYRESREKSAHTSE